MALVFLKEEMCILHFVIKLSQSSKIALEVRIYSGEKPTFLKGLRQD